MRTGYADFWKLRRLNVLPLETSNYVPVILAMTIMAKNAKDYGLDNLELEPPLEFDTLELQTPTHLALVADAVERPLSELKELNPAVFRSVAPAGYKVHVPKGTLPALEAAFSVVPPDRRDSWRLHRVQEGETFATLSKRYSAPAVSLSSANHNVFPGAGEWAAVPVGYPGDRVPKPAPVRRRTASGGAVKSATRSSRTKTTVAKATPVTKTSATRSAAATKGTSSKGTSAKSASSKGPIKTGTAAKARASVAAAPKGAAAAAAVKSPASKSVGGTGKKPSSGAHKPTGKASAYRKSAAVPPAS